MGSRRLIVSAVLLATLPACSESADDADTAPARTTLAPAPTTSLSTTTSWSIPVVSVMEQVAVPAANLKELSARASVIAVVEPTGDTSVFEVGGAPVVTVVTSRLLKGSTDAEFDIVGGVGEDVTGARVLQPGHRFLVYLMPIGTIGAKQYTELTTVAGPSGVYAEGDAQMFYRVDANSPQFPMTLTLDEAASAAA